MTATDELEMRRVKIADVLHYDDFIFALCAFLDDFKRSNDKYSLICDEPDTEVTDVLNLCVIAAVAHKLSNDHGLAIPEWIMKDQYIMPYAVYAFGTISKEYQKFLVETSPSEFSCRNLYFGANAIERV
jgi:hypothetical protein